MKLDVKNVAFATSSYSGTENIARNETGTRAVRNEKLQKWDLPLHLFEFQLVPRVCMQFKA